MKLRSPDAKRATDNFLETGVYERAGSSIAYLIFDEPGPAQLQRRSATGLRPQARPHLLLDQQLEHRTDLIVQIAIDAITMYQVAPQAKEPRNQRHS